MPRRNYAVASFGTVAAARLQQARPIFLALMIGLALGTAVSGLVGWQVPKAIARSPVEAAVLEQKALFCESQARAERPEPSRLELTAQHDLAGKWAVMPGAKSASRSVTDACAWKLAG